MRTFLHRLFCVIMAVAAVSAFCSLSVSAASVKLNRSSLDLPVGYMFTLKVSGTNKSVKWSSSDSSIVYIKSSDGGSAKVVGKKAGKAYIYAKADGISLKCAVTVKKSFIDMSTDDVALEKGQSRKVTLKVTGSKEIMLSNSDKSVCSAAWGKWDGDRIPLTLKGLKSGSTDITVYPKGGKMSDGETLSVTVGNPDTSVSAEADEVVRLINKEREKRGLTPLKSDPMLSDAASQRADEILTYYSHERPDGTSCFSILEDYGITNVYMGENIARGQRSAEEVVRSWMNSKQHRDNILNENYTKIGVALTKQDDIYNCYWVQMFASE